MSLKAEKQIHKRKVLVNTLNMRKCNRVKQTTLQPHNPATLQIVLEKVEACGEDMAILDVNSQDRSNKIPI